MAAFLAGLAAPVLMVLGLIIIFFLFSGSAFIGSFFGSIGSFSVLLVLIGVAFSFFNARVGIFTVAAGIIMWLLNAGAIAWYIWVGVILVVFLYLRRGY